MHPVILWENNRKKILSKSKGRSKGTLTLVLARKGKGTSGGKPPRKLTSALGDKEASLLPGTETQVPTEQEDDWALKRVRTVSEKRKIRPCWDSNSRPLSL